MTDDKKPLVKMYREWRLKDHIEAVRRHVPISKAMDIALFDATDTPKRAKL